MSVRVPQQLFDARDPTPFRERDLDRGFFRHIVSVARELPRRHDFKLKIHIAEKETPEFSADGIREAIHRYFVYKEDYQLFLLKDFLKRTQFYLLTGLIILFSCLGLSEHLEIYKDTWSLSVLKEGLVVIAWVSIWKPIELLMFGWLPIYEEVRFYRKFLRAEIEVKFNGI